MRWFAASEEPWFASYADDAEQGMGRACCRSSKNRASLAPVEREVNGGGRRRSPTLWLRGRAGHSGTGERLGGPDAGMCT